MKCSIVIK